MDGAMKFVKGDAVAGIIIIFVNLIGGLVIGIVQFGMPFAEAAHKYSLLTVGDALISQIPALLISVTAAVIVTRVKGEEQRNLGADIFSQIASDRRSLRLTGAALVFMGLLPGFPTAILAGLGTLFLVAGFAGQRLARLVSGETAPAASEAEGIGGSAAARGADAPAPQAVIEMPPAMAAGFAADELGRRIEAMAAEVAAATGLPPFRIAVAVRDAIADPGFRLLVEDEPVMWSRAPADIVTLPDIPEVLRVHDIPFRRQTTATWSHRLEVPVEHLPALEAAGVAWRDRADMVFADATEGLIKNAAALVGLQETRELLTQAEAQAPVLVAELTRAMPIQRIAEVFRRLLEERVSLRHRRRILEALVEWAPTESNPLALTEYCRIALKRQVCEALSHDDRQITAIVVERDTEEILRASLRDTNIGSYLVLSEDQTQDLLKAVQGQVRTLAPRGIRPAIITSFDVRRHLKTFLTRNSIEIEVISFQELCDDYTAVPCSTLALKPTLRAPADSRRLKPPTRGDAPP
jgi:type III secretion protein V